jgi:hypothetical protein
MKTEQYIPENYKSTKNNQLELFYCKNAKLNEIDAIFNTSTEAINSFKSYFKFSPKYNCNFIVYNSVKDVFQVTGKHFNNTSLCVLYADKEQSFISMFSASENILNGNQQRQYFHILHELSHVWITIITNSDREINNQNRNLKIPIWLDEGISEFIALSITNNQLQLNNCINAFHNNCDKEILVKKQFDFYGKNSAENYEIATGLTASLYGNKELNENLILDLIRKFV